jgi:hypothetical protein
MNPNLIKQLLESPDPSIRFRTRVELLDESKENEELKERREEIKHSARVEKLLAGRGEDGRFPWSAYQKWKGAFWVLLSLTDLEYPSGDQSLVPLRDQVMEWLFSEKHLSKIRQVKGLYRRCALQEAGAVLAAVKLGLVDEHVRDLVECLLKWQWPDGGWNCDKNPEAHNSSYYETWIPLRALIAYNKLNRDDRVERAIDNASEVILKRNLFRRLTNGEVIAPRFIQLAYPRYWHYDILGGLIVMREAGRLDDPRCKDALDLLASKQLPGGGFSAEAKYYTVTSRDTSGVSPVDWGPSGTGKMNEFVTVDALSILRYVIIL